MAQFEPLVGEIEEAGAQLAYLAAEKRSGFFKPEQYLEKNPISYPFLLDEDRTVTKAYGLYHRIGIDAINIAHPATLVIGKDKLVRFIYRGDNQLDRVAIDEAMKIVASLRD
jgi:peroxiredoxin